jgi:hypothetical protein
MAGVVDPVTNTTTFTKQPDHILVEMELINRQLDDHNNRFTAMERNVSLLSLSVLLSPSAQMQLASPTVAETSEGEATHCFPSRGALLLVRTSTPVAFVSHDRAAPLCVQIGTTLCAIAMPRPPLLPSALTITHTHVAARARVTIASKAGVHFVVTATAKDRT